MTGDKVLYANPIRWKRVTSVTTHFNIHLHAHAHARGLHNIGKLLVTGGDWCRARPSRNLPPPLPPLEPSPELVASLVSDTGLPIEVVRRWLDGGSVPPASRDALRESLWRPLGGTGGIRKYAEAGRVMAITPIRNTPRIVSFNASTREQASSSRKANGSQARSKNFPTPLGVGEGSGRVATNGLSPRAAGSPRTCRRHVGGLPDHRGVSSRRKQR